MNNIENSSGGSRNLNDSKDSLAGGLTSHSCGMTHQGRVRENNQDQFLIAQLNKSMRVTATSLLLEDRLFGQVQGEVLLVADGMGGHAAGEHASRIAIDQLVTNLLGSIHWHFHGDVDREDEFMGNLESLLRNAHSRILLESAQNVDQRGMGTTLTMAYVVWPKLYVVHAGDSRCYLVRDGMAQQLTTDHTLARQMVEAGGLKPEDEAGSKWSNVLWNVLGGRSDGGEITAEVRQMDLKNNDRIVLCSDGLHRYFTAEQLAQVVGSDSNPESADLCEKLIQLANEAGGEDNITVIVSQPTGSDITKSTWIDDYDHRPPVSTQSLPKSDDLLLETIDTDEPDDSSDDFLHDTLPE
ncbi:protein phosphatase 2C domain-containing protein [Rubripirellula amarantea]|nr:protein phosphatase 2C domain-containing protein [Rubripirellula amarantea]